MVQDFFHQQYHENIGVSCHWITWGLLVTRSLFPVQCNVTLKSSVKSQEPKGSGGKISQPKTCVQTENKDAVVHPTKTIRHQIPPQIDLITNLVVFNLHAFQWYSSIWSFGILSFWITPAPYLHSLFSSHVSFYRSASTATRPFFWFHEDAG